ncbi:unnamed protein product [Leuciscus chuanchicus]
MDGSPRYQSIPSHCSVCGTGASFSMIRISAGEMESYHRFLGVCLETELAAKRTLFGCINLFELKGGTENDEDVRSRTVLSDMKKENELITQH